MSFPDPVSPVAEPLSQPEQNKILLADDPWSDKRAMDIVRSDWAYAESYRVNAHDWRYRNADELYLGWQGQNYWDGTRVPRSSLSVPVAFMQIEALLPKVSRPLTNPDSYHFYSETDLGKDEELIVLAWREMVLKQLEESKWSEQLRRAIKCMAQYGNGIIEVGFEEYVEEYVEFSSSTAPPKTAIMHHPVAGPITVPVEQSRARFNRKVTQETKKRPYVRYVSLKDCFCDPNCESPCPQDAAYWIKRTYMHADAIKKLKGQKDFNIPDDVYLSELSKSKSTAQADVSKLMSELFRYNQWNPMQDYSSDPSKKRIPVIEYTTNERKIWWLQGTEDIRGVIYNQPNRYRQINFFSAPYAEVLDRWHALSVTDVIEGEQRLEGAIVNARIDELALNLHRGMIKRRGVTIPAYQLKTRPGRVIETENPENDIKESEPTNITQQAYVEVEASERRTQKITGITDLAALGTPSTGGNSANRTAAGIQTQAGATQDRIAYLIETIEDILVEPVVNSLIRYDKKFLDLSQAANWIKLDPRFRQLDPIKVMNARIVAECRASGKMAARQNFLLMFPQFAQFALNPEFLQLMAMQNQETINVKEVFSMFMEGMNYSPKSPLIIPLTQQQISAQQQPPPNVRAQMQTEQMKQQSKEKIDSSRGIVKILDTILKQMAEGHRDYAQLDDKFLLEMAKAHLSTGIGEGGEGEDTEAVQ